MIVLESDRPTIAAGDTGGSGFSSTKSPVRTDMRPILTRTQGKRVEDDGKINLPISLALHFREIRTITMHSTLGVWR